MQLSAVKTSITEVELNCLLSSSDFSVSEYLNRALRVDDNLLASCATYECDDKESLMTELVLYLQIQTQACHDEIGKTSAEIRAVLPRCATDLGRLEVGLNGMKDDALNLLGLDFHQKSILIHEDMVNSKDKFYPISDLSTKDSRQSEAIQALKLLSELQSLSFLLMNTKTILMAASTYKSTLKLVPSLLISPSTISQAVSSFLTLKQGTDALVGLPGKDKRVEELYEIKQKILIQLKPVLIHALQKMETRLGPLQTCVDMYHSLDEINFLIEEYVKSRPASVQKNWFEYGKVTDPARVDISTVKLENGDVIGTQLKRHSAYDIDFAKDFELWLPTWYETVSHFILEENRKAKSVFGSELAPEIILRILNECFDHILPSFKARLESMCLIHDISVSPDLRSRFGSIVKTYIATANFISVVYEQIFDFNGTIKNTNSNVSLCGKSNLDTTSVTVATESGHQKSLQGRKTAVELFMFTHETIFTIASPFIAYQRNFSEFELKGIGSSVAMIATQIRNAVAPSTSLDILESVNYIQTLVPSIYPHLLEMITRFESFNCGYSSQKLLQTIDSLLSSHFGELSIAINTLSTNIHGSHNSNDVVIRTEVLDVQQVQAAVEVLTIASVLEKDMISFEDKIKGRLLALIDTMRSSIDEYIVLIKRSDLAPMKSLELSAIPDSLSITQTLSFLSAVAFRTEIHDITGATEYFVNDYVSAIRFLSITESQIATMSQMFPRSFSSMNRLIRNCQLFMFDVCSSLPLNLLRGLTSNPNSNQNIISEVESYGILPQLYITQIGEHILALVQALEPFSNQRDTIKFSNLDMNNIDHVATSCWNSLATKLQLNAVDDERLQRLMKGRDMESNLIGYSKNDCNTINNIPSVDSHEDSGENVFMSETTNFSNKWLDAVGMAITGMMIEYILSFDRLTQQQCDHMAVDITYLMNVFNALGIPGHPHPLLGHVVELVKTDLTSLQKCMAEKENDGSFVYHLNMAVARMRGYL